MRLSPQTVCTAFEGARCIASGDLESVALKTKEVIDRGEQAPVIIFDDNTCRPIEVDFRGTLEDVVKRLSAGTGSAVHPLTPTPVNQEASRGPGRPKLGVVAREVTLLPRHWDWLNRQPGGASVALRKLVDEARHDGESKDRIRQSQEAAYRFMNTLAGNLPGFEEATRALFAGQEERFGQLIESWPPDVRDYAKRVARGAFE